MHANKTFRHITVMLNILQMILNCQKKDTALKKTALFYFMQNLTYFIIFYISVEMTLAFYLILVQLRFSCIDGAVAHMMSASAD